MVKHKEQKGCSFGKHYTCISTPLSAEKGSRPEHISIQRLEELHELQTGVPISRVH